MIKIEDVAQKLLDAAAEYVTAKNAPGTTNAADNAMEISQAKDNFIRGLKSYAEWLKYEEKREKQRWS